MRNTVSSKTPAITWDIDTLHKRIFFDIRENSLAPNYCLVLKSTPHGIEAAIIPQKKASS